MEPKYFVPVCLYPHTKYRTKQAVEYLFTKYMFGFREHLIIIADRLLALDNLVTGRYWSANAVFSKARRDAEPVFRLICNVSRRLKADNSGKIVYWDDVAETSEFTAFSERMRHAILCNEMLSSSLEKGVTGRVRRFGLGACEKEERHFEREYLLSEVCMSVYCTEILDYPCEIWERPPLPELPDPLKLLYRHFPEVVVEVTGHSPRRALSFLFEGHSEK
jgi:hypothetical protein